ncbi:hypothetical protein ACOMHN_027541 [Nucella lapillus]
MPRYTAVLTVSINRGVFCQPQPEALSMRSTEKNAHYVFPAQGRDRELWADFIGQAGHLNVKSLPQLPAELIDRQAQTTGSKTRTGGRKVPISDQNLFVKPDSVDVWTTLCAGLKM